MLDFLRAGNRQPRGEPFGQLTIEKRVLVTPKSTISIPNITVISAGTVPAANRIVRGVVLALVIGAAAALSIGDARAHAPLAVAGAAMALAALVLGIFFSRTHKPSLAVSTSDGQVSLFTGRPHTLEEARRLLTEKINADDETAVYRINFENGAIQTVGAGHAGPIGAIVAGAGNQVADPRPKLQLGTPHTYAHAARSPAAQLGNGHIAGSNSLHVDYSQILPQITEMQRFYAQRQDTQEIAERLGELEHLMRSGTPTAGSRSRLGQLSGDLSMMLGAYPGVAQIFQQAARLAGF
jgi:hypothetical protein